MISSEIHPDCLDSTVGLALHEASHVAITDFQVIKDLMDKKNIDKKYHSYTKFIKNLHNWVEDRRIDYWAYNKAPGYKIYYKALYERYFFSDKVAEIIEKEAENLAVETARNYEFFIVNSLHPDVTMTELNGLPEIEKIIDIENNPQKWKNTQDTLEASLKIFDVIIKNIDPEEQLKITNANYELSFDELGDLLREILKGQEDFLDGEVHKIELDGDTAKILKALMASQTKVEELTDDVGEYEVLTVNRVDESTIHANLYSIFRPEMGERQEPLIRRGLALGTALGRKLKLRNDENKLVTLNQRSGKISKRTLHSAGHGNETIFYNSKEEKYNDLAVHISVDMSGSMGGKKWENTLIGLVAIAKATSMINGVRTQISLRFGDNVTKGSRYSWDCNEAVVINFYDSAHESIKKINLLKYVTPSGSTPEGLCFEALAQKIMKPLINKYTLFINFSDGAPWFQGVSTKRAIKITKNFIEKMRATGAHILSYYISEGEYVNQDEIEQFKEMYGKGAEFIDVNSMMELTKTINKKFLQLGK